LDGLFLLFFIKRDNFMLPDTHITDDQRQPPFRNNRRRRNEKARV